MNPPLPEIARLGAKRIAVVAPSSNPTVEPEMRVLIPDAVAQYTARLPVVPGDLRARTLVYADHYPAVLAGFGPLRLDAAFIAMTGGTYRHGEAGDRALCRELARPRGIPVFTASLAIMESLQALGARRISIVSPYPQWLTDESLGYWTGGGMTIQQLVKVSEEFRAYELEDDEVAAAMSKLVAPYADAILLSGTGMMSVRTIIALRERFGVPILSSNISGAFVTLRAVGAKASPTLAAAVPELARLLG